MKITVPENCYKVWTIKDIESGEIFRSGNSPLLIATDFFPGAGTSAETRIAVELATGKVHWMQLWEHCKIEHGLKLILE